MADENMQSEQQSIDPNQEVSSSQQTEQPRPEQPKQSGDYKKANLGKRFLAVVIDSLILIPVWFVFFSIKLSFIGGLVTLAYSFLKDGINFGGLDNRSIGKKIMGIRVMNTKTGARCDYKDSLLRQILFIIPVLNMLIILVEIVLVFADDKGIRLGDKIAKTMVIEEA